MTIRPIDRHRHANASETRIAEIESEIATRGVEFIYYRLVTLTGRTVAKVVPAEHLRRNLEKGVQFMRNALTDMHTDRAGHLLGGVEATEMTVIPDLGMH